MNSKLILFVLIWFISLSLKVFENISPVGFFSNIFLNSSSSYPLKLELNTYIVSISSIPTNLYIL